MATIGVITGSGFYRPGGEQVSPSTIGTPWGDVVLGSGSRGDHRFVALCRHGEDHRLLSHQVQHQANLWALKSEGVDAIVATSSVGVIDTTVPLGLPIVFDDMFFPSNRLPDGTLATIFREPGDPERGHWIPESPFSPALRVNLLRACRSVAVEVVDGGVYAHADGPRFNTRAELAWLRSVGCAALSQTCGPETVLAGELQIPYALIGFGVNYVAGLPVPVTGEVELEKRLASHGPVLATVLDAFLELLPAEFRIGPDTGPVYRMVRR